MDWQAKPSFNGQWALQCVHLLQRANVVNLQRSSELLSMWAIRALRLL